jgi:hypothetical protein
LVDSAVTCYFVFSVAMGFPMFQEVDFDDGRGEYSDVIRARAPRGLRERVKEVAEQEGVSAAELIRRAVFSYLNGEKSGCGGLSFEARA